MIVKCIVCKQVTDEQFSSPTCCQGRVCHKCEQQLQRNAKPINSAAFQRLNELWDVADEKSCQNSR